MSLLYICFIKDYRIRSKKIESRSVMEWLKIIIKKMKVITSQIKNSL